MSDTTTAVTTIDTSNLPMEGNLMQPATVAELTAQVQTIQRCMKALMKPGCHYGVVPGCGDKPTLLKPGAELIMTLFRISPEPEVDREFDGFDTTYRVKVKGVHIPTGNVVGYGLGEASTNEKKYKWRRAVCDAEYENAEPTRRQIAYIKKNGQVYEEKQVRQNPADILNTVVKMAKKRALVDLCLTATACSDIFVQDLDDPAVADMVREEQAPAQRYQAPQRKAPAPAPAPQSAPAPSGNVISDAQRKRLYAIGKGKGMTNEDMASVVFEIAGVERSGDIPRDLYEDVCNAFENFGGANPEGVDL